MFVPFFFFCTGTKDHSREVHLQVTMNEDCEESTGDCYFLCDTVGAWGIVLEFLASIGIAVTVLPPWHFSSS